MAVSMNQEKTLSILKVLFPAGSQPGLKASMLMEAGAVVQFGLFHFSIKVDNDHVFTTKFQHLAAQITDGSLTPPEMQLIASKVEQVIEDAFKLYPTISNKPEIDITSTPVVEPELVVAPKKPKPVFMTKQPPTKKEVAAAAEAVAEEKIEKVKTKPVAEVLPLKAARAVGQAVKGTSSGSVYRTVAVGPVNLAVKMGAGGVSIRAEPQSGVFTTEAKKRLTEAGFSDHSGNGYMSVHLNTGSVPPWRVAGAVLYTIGMSFEQVATSEKELNA